MEVRILHKFHDRADFSKVYPVGETFTFDDARAEHLIKRGLAEAIAEEAIEEVPVVETEEVEVAEEPVVEEAVVEEAVVKPVATKRRSASKDN